MNTVVMKIRIKSSEFLLEMRQIDVAIHHLELLDISSTFYYF